MLRRERPRGVRIPSAGAFPAPDQSGDVARLRIQDALRQAHHALDAGDRLEALRQARRAEQIALQWQVTFAPGEENPRELAAQLSGDVPSSSLAANGPTQPQSELKLQATRLVEEANAALQAGDLDTAHAKATEAANLNVAFGPFETQPFHILTEIFQPPAGQPDRTVSRLRPELDADCFQPTRAVDLC